MTHADAPRTLFAPDFAEKPYWWEGIATGVQPEAPLPKTVDVAIVGAGVAGLNAALELARGGRSVLVLDAGIPGHGASTRNTGFLGRFLKKSLAELVSIYGPEKAAAYYTELHTALNDSMSEVIAREGIDCDFTYSGRVVLARSAAQLAGVVKEFELRRQLLGEEIHVLDLPALRREIACSDVFCGGVMVPDMAAIHPGKYHAGLLAAVTRAEATVCGNARVTDISRTSGGTFALQTPRGATLAKEVIVATNGYTDKQGLGWFARRLVPFQGFVIATEELGPARLLQLMPTNRTYTDADFDTMAIRVSPDGKRIITSGRTGKAMPLRDKAAMLHRDLVLVFPDLHDVQIGYAWSGFCAAPFDAMPKIGKRPDGVWYATGFTFMGMPQGSYFGRKIGQRLLGDPAGDTLFADAPFEAPPLYTGNPWFLGPYMSVMRIKDHFANR